MSRTSTVLATKPTSSPLKTLARTPDEHAKVEEARRTLVLGAPEAAQTLVNGGSKEDIAAAKDVLDRVGLAVSVQHEDQTAPQTMSAFAEGAFRAMIDAFGIKVDLPARLDDVVPTFSVREKGQDEALSPLEDKQGAVATPRQKKAPRSDSFLLQFENEPSHAKRKRAASQPTVKTKRKNGRNR